MSELSGLELRRAACEVLGWSIRPSVGTQFHRTFFAAFDPSGRIISGWQTEDALVCVMPAIESDPAVSEPLFLKWCAKRTYTWKMEGLERAYLSVYLPTDTFSASIRVVGATPSEARARAIVAAVKEKA